MTLFGAVPILECVMDILELIDRVRQNHAIEHATIAVLGRKHDQFGRLGGSAKQDGFFVYGPTTADRIEEAANEAVERLRAGESHLAISPFCGTNFLLGGMTTALLTGMILGTRNRVGRLPQAMGLSALALIGSFRAGGYVQRKWTTKADIGGLEIKGVSQVSGAYRPLHRVYTWLPDVVDEPQAGDGTVSEDSSPSD